VVRWWCFLRWNSVWRHAILMARTWPDPVTPATDVDKFMWRKIFDHNPLFVMACDKLASKAYAQSRRPDLKVAEVLWTGLDTDLIPEEALTGDVVVKSNHGSGRYVMVRDGQVDRTELRQKARRWLTDGYGVGRGEWAYRNVVRQIFVERMLTEKDGSPIETEYKFHVSCGWTAYVLVQCGKDARTARSYYLDREGRVSLPARDEGKAAADFGPPACFGRMCEIAETLAEPFDYLRCDLYERDGTIYLSEFTVYPLSGKGGNSPHLREARNRAWDLRNAWFLATPQRGWRKVYAESLARWLDLS
jgi:hypothetical protein